MKEENVLEVLFYLYKNYLDMEANWDNDQQNDIVLELEDKGFERSKIDKAFEWLERLKCKENLLEFKGENSIRVYQEDECHKLSIESRGLIVFLEQIQILKPKIREIVIQQAMMLDSDIIQVEQTKWIILMVLCHQPEQKQQLALLGDCVLASAAEYMH